MTEMLNDAEMVAVARAIATIAHSGQVDKAGSPYINHPRRVAESLIEAETYRAGDIAVAWLHDVLEDTSITESDLQAAGIPYGIIGDVKRLTRTPDQAPEDYYAEIHLSQRARRVKLADIADNMDAQRLSELEDATIVRLVRKYGKALLMLGAQR